MTTFHGTDTLLCFLSPLFVRIAGDTALEKNIHESVSAQIKKNFAKSKWKVSQTYSLSFMQFDFLTCVTYVEGIQFSYNKKSGLRESSQSKAFFNFTLWE